MKRLVALFCLILTVNVEAKHSVVAPILNYTELMSEHETISCSHLKKRHSMRSDAYSMIELLNKVFLKGDKKWEDLLEAMNYYLYDLQYHEDNFALSESHLVKWILSDRIQNDKPVDAFAIVELGEYSISNSKNEFSNPRHKLINSSDTLIIESRVRPYDICLEGGISLLPLFNCKSDNYKYVNCDGEHCINPEPVIFIETCKSMPIRLDLSPLAEKLGGRKTSVKRKRLGYSI